MRDVAKRTSSILIPLWHRLSRAAWASVPALAAGIAASLFATTVMMLLRLTAGIVTLPELVGERILPHLDANTFVHLLIIYGKIKPLELALAGQIVLGVLIAPLLPVLAQRLPFRLRDRQASLWPSGAEWLAGGLIALVLWLLAVALFWPVLAENLLGFPVSAARLITCLGFAAIFGCYGVVLVIVYHILAASAVRSSVAPARSADLGTVTVGRRALLARSAAVAVASLALGGFAIDALLQALYRRSNLSYEGMSTHAPVAYLTPNDQFYVVSKNVLDPGVVLGDWALDVGGLVARPERFDLRKLQALAQETRAVTLECIANGVSGGLISTAVWHGVTLATLLEASGGTQPAASQVVFTSADGYQSSLPLRELLSVGTLVAWEMNGAPLPHHHGYPLRVVVPGHFGEQSPKWLTRIDAVDHTVQGFYQQQGWYSGQVYTISRIDNPKANAHLPLGQPVEMYGIAYGGVRGIRSVEVSTDGGTSWRLATLQPALSPQTWVLWSFEWRPGAPGAYTLVVRATDGTGMPQITRQQGTVPNGGTGLHSLAVTVG